MPLLQNHTVNLPNTTLSVKPSNPEILKIQPPVSSSVDTKQFQVIISDLIRTTRDWQSHLAWKRSTTGGCWTDRETWANSATASKFCWPYPLSIGYSVHVSLTQPVNEQFLLKVHYIKAVSKLRTFAYPSSDLQYCRCKWKSWTNTTLWLLPGQPVHQLDDFHPRGKQDILCIWCSKISREKSWKKLSKRVWQGELLAVTQFYKLLFEYHFAKEGLRHFYENSCHSHECK